MADSEPIDDTPQISDSDSSEDESDNAPVESLIAGRERRKTAGNRYDRDMILEEAAAEDEPDEVTLLFADNEEDEDEEFKSSDGEDDADMSSSDDDDQGPNAPVDDLEGENQLQKQAKDERAKKRKADLALTSVAGLRKRLKTDPTRPAVAPVEKKLSKKKERVTWVHDQDSGRSSLRKQTIAHRAETIARLKESEAQSKKLKALKEQRDKERARDAPKELTQADRLAEAARVERQNAKSLNRWEAMEKKRQAEQAAKLAALKNRKLEGPVVTWWSAKAKWVGPKLKKIGRKDTVDVMEGAPETKKRGRKSKAFLEQLAAAKSGDVSSLVLAPTSTAAPKPTPSSTAEPPKDHLPEAAPSADEAQPQITLTAPQETDDSFPKGTHEHATTHGDSNASGSNRVSPAPHDSKVPQNLEEKSEAQTTARELPNDTSTPSDLPEDIPIQVIEKGLCQKVPAGAPEGIAIKPEGAEPEQSQIPAIIEPTAAPEPEPVIEHSARNLVVLEKFDDLPSENRQEYALFYNHRKSAKPVKHSQELCPITGLPVRYRDPSTRIGYANVAGYKKLQELKQHRFVWSTMLGCYVGRDGGTVARGVPDGFSVIPTGATLGSSKT